MATHRNTAPWNTGYHDGYVGLQVSHRSDYDAGQQSAYESGHAEGAADAVNATRARAQLEATAAADFLHTGGETPPDFPSFRARHALPC